MPSIRKTTTASGSVAVQVVRYENRKVVVMKHVGSGRTPAEVAALVESARAWMEKETLQPSLFPKTQQRTLSLATTKYLGAVYTFARDVLLHVAQTCGFNQQHDALLIDLAIMRLIEPASKLRSIELLERYFGITYSERAIYRTLPRLHQRKRALEDAAAACAIHTLESDLTLVLYDVTTLYFETFTDDELRKPGFSKDNKPQQPQIVIGLLVTRQGFPVGYEIFAGNTFEGHTMIPVLESFASKHRVTTPTVVADAAMLSYVNIAELKQKNFSYIVGARLANASPTLITKLHDALAQRDGAITRLPTPHGDLIASFSHKRYRKNKGDLERQIERGKKLVARGEPGRRAKFVTKDGGEAYVLNEALIEKTKKLLGIRGYYTNIPTQKLSNEEVIAHYHALWHVEQTFRVAKSDLASRPIFHHHHDAIKAHILVCFVALVLGKYVEIRTGSSVRMMRDILWSVTDAKMIDTASGETFTFRSPVSGETKVFLRQLGVSY